MSTPVVHQVGIFDSSGNFYFPRDVVSGTLTVECAGGSPDWTGGQPLKSVEVSITDGVTTESDTATSESRSVHEDTKYAEKALAAVAGGIASLPGKLGVFACIIDTTQVDDGERTVTITGTGGDDTTHSYTFVLWINNDSTISDDNVYIDADNGDDTTGDGSAGNPWETWEKARNYVASNHSTTNRVIINAVGGTTAEYSRTRGSGFTRQTTGPRMITRGIGGSRAKFGIPTNSECRLSYQRWENCNFDAEELWAESNGQFNDIAFEECDLKSDAGRASMTYTSGSLFEGADVDATYMFRCEIGDYNKKGITTKAWMRDSWIIDVSEDAIDAIGIDAAVSWPGNCYYAVYVENTDTQYTGLGNPHGDAFQIIDTASSHRNILAANCVFADVGYSGQNFLVDNVVGFAFYNIVMIHNDASTSAFSQMGQSIGGQNIEDVIIANITHPNHAFGWRVTGNTVNAAAIHSAIIKEFNTGLGDTGTSATDIAVADTTSTTSDTEVDVLSTNPFIDGVSYNEDYTATKDDYSPKDSNGLPTVAAGDRFTFVDVIGRYIADDGTAPVGALSPVAAEIEDGTPAGNVTGAYANAGSFNIFLVMDGTAAYSGGSPYPFTVSNGTGSTELVTGVTMTTTTVLNDTYNIQFSGDTPQAGDTNWTLSLNNLLVKATGENGVPIADFTDLAVTVLSAGESITNRLTRFGRGDARLARR